MRFTDVILPTLAENLALDEALLVKADAGGPEVLRVWEWTEYAVVLGAGGKWAGEADAEACRADGVPILRRGSGGGTVLLGPGCLLFSLVLSFERRPVLADLHASYRLILNTIAEGLAPWAAVACRGTSDLAIGDKKFSGNSQQRKRGHLLHHGTILHDFDLSQIPRYVRHPLRQPDYRQGRAHGEFVVNFPARRALLTTALRAAWQAESGLPVLPVDLMEKLMAEKYRREDWHLRR